MACNAKECGHLAEGNPRENEAKFRQVFLYILSKVGGLANVGKTVLFKLLYFIDFNYYELYEEPLMGLIYLKKTYGPMPKNFDRIAREMISEGLIRKFKHDYHGLAQERYSILVDSDIGLLSAKEIGVIDDVLNSHAKKNAALLSDLSHRDTPWLGAQKGKELIYESVFYRAPETSVRSYDENDRD
jgi:uncharacterized phage-associated protein